MEALKTFLDTPAGGVTAFAVGACCVFLIFQVHRRLIADRQYAGQVAAVESQLGFSATWTAPLTAFSNGDTLGTIKALKAKFEYALTPGNVATELTTVFSHQYMTNPKFASDIDKFMADVKSGVDSKTLTADLQQTKADVPGISTLGLPPGVVDLQHIKAKIDAIKANPSLAGVLAHLPDAQGILAGLFSATHDIGVATATAAPVVAAAVPPLAPAAAVAGAAGVAASGINIANVPADHTVTVAGPVTSPNA